MSAYKHRLLVSHTDSYNGVTTEELLLKLAGWVDAFCLSAYAGNCTQALVLHTHTHTLCS